MFKMIGSYMMHNGGITLGLYWRFMMIDNCIASLLAMITGFMVLILIAVIVHTAQEYIDFRKATRNARHLKTTKWMKTKVKKV